MINQQKGFLKLKKRKKKGKQRLYDNVIKKRKDIKYKNTYINISIYKQILKTNYFIEEPITEDKL